MLDLEISQNGTRFPVSKWNGINLKQRNAPNTLTAQALASRSGHDTMLGMTRQEHDVRKSVRCGSAAAGAVAIGAIAFGALAVGALAVGSMAIGALAIKRFALKRGAIDSLTIRELTLDQLTVRRMIRAEES